MYACCTRKAKSRLAHFLLKNCHFVKSGAGTVLYENRLNMQLMF